MHNLVSKGVIEVVLQPNYYTMVKNLFWVSGLLWWVGGYSRSGLRYWYYILALNSAIAVVLLRMRDVQA